MDFLIYLGKSSLFLILLYGFYHLLIRRTTFFRLNRAYLLASLPASFALPLISIEEQIVMASQAISPGLLPPAAVGQAPSAAGDSGISLPQVFLALYICGALIALGILLFKLARILKLLKSHLPDSRNGIRISILNGSPETGSFSFLNRIFISKTDFEHHFEAVYAHEAVHVSQRHSLDILLVEICGVILWFNPVLKLYKQSLREVHEFLADTSASDKDTYARFLVAYAMSGDCAYGIAHPFFNPLSLKKRIEMLYKKPDPAYALARYLPVIPAAALLVLLTASRQYSYIPDKTISTHTDAIHTGADTLHTETTQALALTEFSTPLPAATLTRKADGRKVTGKVIDSADNAPLPGAAVIVKGTQTGTTTDSEGRFVLEVPANHDELFFSFVGYRSQAIRISDKTELVVVLRKQETQLEKVVVTGYGPVGQKDENTAKTSSTQPTAATFTVVENMPEYPGGQHQLTRYLAQNLRYPAEAASAKVQGTVFVSFTVNPSGYIRNPRIVKGIGYGADEEALRIVTSMPRWQPGIQNGRPVNVELSLPISFQLASDKQSHAAPAQTTGKPGDIIHVSPVKEPVSVTIRTTEPVSPEPENPYFSSPAELRQLRDEPALSLDRLDPGKKPLILVDGKEKHNINALNPEDIESITVLKNRNALEQYGEKAANGVILVQLKKKK